MLILEIIFFAIGLTIGYFLIKDAVKKAILEAHEEMGTYKPPKKEEKTEGQSVTIHTTVGEMSQQKKSGKTEMGTHSRFINNWICPHCETINSSKNTRCLKCGKLPTER